MKESFIYTIGHGNKTSAEFIEELKEYNIEYLFDVRSKPQSRFNIHFNRSYLERDLLENGITYFFLGDHLGGLPNDISCYKDGKVDYNIVRTKDFFKEGIRLLLEANDEKMKIALMCSESKPEECHRSKLIGEELREHQISLKHIIDLKNLKEQNDLINIIVKGKNTSNLFGEKESLRSKKKY